MFKGFKNKANMFLVFIWWLTHAKDGKCTYGQYQIAKDTGISRSSVRRAIVNLAFSEQEVDIKADNPFSTVLILNWNKYQDKPNKKPTSKRPASGQEADTNKNKNIDIYTACICIEDFQKKYPNKDVKGEFDKSLDWLIKHDFKDKSKKPYKDLERFFKNWLERSFDKLPSKYIATDGKGFANDEELNYFLSQKLYKIVSDENGNIKQIIPNRS